MIKIIKHIISYLSEFKARLYLGMALSLLGNMIGAVPIFAGVYLINGIVEDRNGTKELTANYVLFLTVVIVTSLIARWIVTYIRAVKQESITHEVTSKQRLKTGEILKRVPLGFMHSVKTGEIASSVTTDLAFFEIHTMNTLNKIVDSYTFLMVTIIYLLVLFPAVGLIALVSLVLSSIALHLIERQSKKNSPKRQKNINEMADEMIQYIRGMTVVKSYKQEGVSVKGLYDTFGNSRVDNIKMEKDYAPFDILHRLALNLGVVCIILFMSIMAIQGNVSLPMAIMMIVYSFIMFNSIETANTSMHMLEILEEVLVKLEKIETATIIDEDGKHIDLEHFDIAFDNVTFAYDTRTVIDDITFTIPESTTTAIVGASGSGKTTICNLISRFYDVNGGSIKIGGVDVREFNCDSLLSNVSSVFQKVYLFNDTIYNNIKFGKPDATREEIETVAKKARCHDFIMALPEGYDTIIAEGGATLSGGEKQRISIARAMLKNAPIILLDESTASVDPENEHLISAAISELTSGKTIIIIAHRLATIENVDQILVMDDGKIVQRGTHKTLCEEEGRYKDFIEIRKVAENWSV